ncbi:uncharacterized protein fam217bb isoform X2 [Leuresthes tenuis]|uniref:uncharacterized protein fam217bb isoform X2 n=1 Tax=Leuresthes tenuis TaxID=355514 RepID=UPI003B514B50
MGTILQERVTQRCLERASTRDREWKKKVSWSNSDPIVVSKMGRRQSQRKSTQPQLQFPSQENNHEKKPQRRKHKSNIPSTKYKFLQHSAQGISVSHPVLPAEGRMEVRMQSAAQHCGHREHKPTAMRGCKLTIASSFHQLLDSSSALLETTPPQLEVGGLRSRAQEDSDTDLSECERLPVSSPSREPPQLELRPEVIEAEDCVSHSYKIRGQNHVGFDFPDFLPPPFNSWSLSQLAVFYNMEGRAAPRPRPVGPLERYLERLLQLEWNEIQTIQEDSGKSAVSEMISSCHRLPAASSSRLSSPKCILQCQRAFPLTFLASLASHSTLLSGCGCTLCRIHYTTCSTSGCRSLHSYNYQSRLSPMLERSRGPTSLPKRSYSESRVHSSERNSRAQRFSSPVMTNSYLRRMQASGNIRNPIQGATTRTQSTVRDSIDHVGKGDVLESKMGVFSRRSGSEQRRMEAERHQNGSEKRRSSSDCRKGRAEQRRLAKFQEQEIIPDAVPAI